MNKQLHDRAIEALNKVYAEVMGIPQVEKGAKRCWACGNWLNKGQGRMFIWACGWADKKIVRVSRLLHHKFRKDCSDKARWTKAHKEHLKLKKMGF